MKTITKNWQRRARSPALACILVLALFCGGAATAAEKAPAPPLEKIRIAYSSISGN